MCRIAEGFLVIVVLLLAQGECVKNVLVINGAYSPSHQNWIHVLANAVAEHGYNVTTIGCIAPKKQHPNVHYSVVEDMYTIGEYFNYLDLTHVSPWEAMHFHTMDLHWMEALIVRSDAMRTLMNYPQNFTFDLIIYDYDGPLSFLVLGARFPTARLIGACAYPDIAYTYLMTGGLRFPSFAPLYMPEVKNSFYHRLESFFVYAVNDYLFANKFATQAEEIVDKYWPMERKPLLEIMASTAITLTNFHPLLNDVAPILPSVIPVGGLQIETPKPLPGDLEKIYSEAPRGVILFTLGSNVKGELLGEERLQGILDALSEFPEYNVIWKINLSKLPLRVPKNVFVTGWLPQNDILADNRTKLFISHAGGLSIQEASWYGVPMLTMPLMFDQYPNADKLVNQGIALKLDIWTIEKDQLQNALTELLYQDHYRKAAQARSIILRDQMETPMERALWWIDFVARSPDVSFLKSKQLQEMSYIAKHSIDVVAFLSILMATAVYCTVYFTSYVVQIIKQNRRNKFSLGNKV